MDPIVTVDKSADVYIKVVEREDTGNASNHKGRILSTMTFHVHRKLVGDASSFFRTMLESSNWKDSGKRIIEIEDEVARMRVIFRVLHKVLNVYEKLEVLWPAIKGIDKFGLAIKLFQYWFSQWYSKHKDLYLTRPAILFWPTWRYDEAKGFLTVTRRLAYTEAGHIMEENPTDIVDLHLPSRVIQQINAARGRLRNQMTHGLLKINGELLEASCSCCKETLYDYERHLVDINVWPLEEKMRGCSVNTMLDRLEKFSFSAKEKACGRCRKFYTSEVAGLVLKVRKYFDGLCLDCMDKSKSKYSDDHEDYWAHDEMGQRDWSRHCRVTHGQPSWYFSFMGRKEDRDSFNRREKKLASAHRRRYRRWNDPDSESSSDSD